MSHKFKGNEGRSTRSFGHCHETPAVSMLGQTVSECAAVGHPPSQGRPSPLPFTFYFKNNLKKKRAWKKNRAPYQKENYTTYTKKDRESLRWPSGDFERKGVIFSSVIKMETYPWFVASLLFLLVNSLAVQMPFFQQRTHFCFLKYPAKSCAVHTVTGGRSALGTPRLQLHRVNFVLSNGSILASV